jgi:hypothetical protein
MSDFRGKASEEVMTWIELTRSAPHTKNSARQERIYFKSDLLARGWDAFQFRSHALVPRSSLSESFLKTFSSLQKMTGQELTIEVTQALDPQARRPGTVQILVPESSLGDKGPMTVYSTEYLIRKSLSKTEHARCVGFLKETPLEASSHYQ